MFGAKLISIFVVSFLAVVTAGKCKKTKPLSPPKCGEDCRTWMRCDPYSYNEKMWTIVDEICHGFNSPCLFQYENCARSYNCQTPMIATSYDNCKKYCDIPRCADRSYNPVCARFTYRDLNNESVVENVDFDNEFAMKKYACENQKPYTDFQYGTC